MTAKPEPALEDVAALLTGVHGGPVEGLAPLPGGFWSAGFAYRAGGDELVLRLTGLAEGYEADRLAQAHANPELPVPQMLAHGEALGGQWSVTRRARGTFLEDLPDAAAPLARVLAGLRAAPVKPQRPWPAWLDAMAADHSDELAADAEVARLHGRAVAAFRAIALPDRQDLVHADLLHQNVLVEDGRATAVFSWKCATVGDFLFDTAWCSFWSPWHPGIEAADPEALTRAAPDVTPADVERADERLRAYRLVIGAGHLGWSLFAQDGHLDRIASRLEEVLAA